MIQMLPCDDVAVVDDVDVDVAIVSVSVVVVVIVVGDFVFFVKNSYKDGRNEA